jgi:serine/threonine protein kinase
LSGEAWRITDFGLTAEGTSRRAYTTQLARGTNAYRAPELLREGSAVVSYESDIWSLGCIFYELATTKKVFASDFAVLEYCYKGELTIPFLPVNHHFKCCLTKVIRSMLEVQWWERPSGRCIRRALTSLCRDSVELHSLVEPEGLYHNMLPDGFKPFPIPEFPRNGEIFWHLRRIWSPELKCSGWMAGFERVEWKPYWYYHLVL